MILYRVTVQPEEKKNIETIEELKAGYGFFKCENPPARIDTDEIDDFDVSDWPDSQVYSSHMPDGSVVFLFKDEGFACYFIEGMKVSAKIIMESLGVGVVDGITGEHL